MTTETILLLLALLFGFYAAWNIGANDVSNAMGTSVGSKALTLRQAVVIAAIFEFGGAILFGSHVSETLQRGIVDPNTFASNPYTLLYGMLAALLAAGIWLQLATYFGLPVSTTHAIVGAIVGFGIVGGGIDAIYWDKVFYIACSWIASPLLGAGISYLLFSILRKNIFYSKNPLEATKKALPWITGSAVIAFSFIGMSNIVFILVAGIAAYLAAMVVFRLRVWLEAVHAAINLFNNISNMKMELAFSVVLRFEELPFCLF